MLPTETRVGNPNLRSDECGSRIPIIHSRPFIGASSVNGKSRIVRTNRDPLGRKTGYPEVDFELSRKVGRAQLVDATPPDIEFIF
jgi:hypothetical protein